MPYLDRVRPLCLVLLILLGSCSVPQVRQNWDVASQPDVAVQGQALPTALPRLPTVTPWPTATSETPMPLDPTVMIPPIQTPVAGDLPQATVTPALTLHSSVPPMNGVAATIDTYMNDLVAANFFSGAVLVAHNGDILISKGYGMANGEQGIANTPRTRFRLASLTKPFTAMAVMMLHDQGKLHIQDSLCRYVASCPPPWRNVTIHHLLSHTSGIPNYTDFLDFDGTAMVPTTRAQLIARFQNEPLLFEPGTVQSYSNSGYVLLGLIIEQAAGQPYEIFLQNNIFAPLQMQNTGYDQNILGRDNHAAGYAVIDQPADFLHSSTLDAAGALYSTVEDLHRWDQALLTDQLIPRTLLNRMLTPVHNNYGYGWAILEQPGQRSFSHTGLISGFSNYIAHYPDERLTIIVLSNLQSSAPSVIGDYVTQLVLQSS